LTVLVPPSLIARHGLRAVALRALVIAVTGAGAAHAQSPAQTKDILPPLRPPLITTAAEQSIQRGLDWLAERQSRDGSWSEEAGYGRYPISMTALAGLALLSSGSTPTQGPYAPQISRAAAFILNSAQEDGLISREGAEGQHSMYGHGFSMLFLAQLYGMEEDADRQRRIRRVLQNAVTLTDRAQSDLGGWYYTPTSNFDEGSVTVTQVQALRACKNVGIAVPKRVIDDAIRYLTNSALPGGGIAYRVGMTQPRPPITAAAVVCWYSAGLSDTTLCRRNVEFCIKTIGSGDDPTAVLGHFFYAHFYMAQAMYLSGDHNWNGYFPKLRERLLNLQRDDGSWNDTGAGSSYGTALSLLILQLPYQYLPIMQR